MSSEPGWARDRSEEAKKHAKIADAASRFVFKFSLSFGKARLLRVDFTLIRRLKTIKVKRVKITRHEKNQQSDKTKHHWRTGAEARLKGNPAVSQDDLAGKLAGQGIVMDRTAVSRIETNPATQWTTKLPPSPAL